ncbi:Nodal modulator 1 [Anabarilius grahami]|uniref:Nodal modulator 1 n=1 Tax=Anabarilius grahami TaxID=495550 RepID=A0A3N0Z8V4_ANAGA|nr:Nodal modulator 1 [Anabarilius grahami]
MHRCTNAANHVSISTARGFSSFILRATKANSLKPTTVDLHVDGITDICTKEQDINFVFTGFSVMGTVLSKGHLLGPSGVEVSLRKAGEDDVLQSVLTQAGGQ